VIRLDFLKVNIPLPPMSTQQKSRQVKAKVDIMKQEREMSIKELDAMLPSILDRAFKGEL
jgi:type I restriction enzyme S subunit